MIPKIDRAQHTHGVHNVADRHVDAHLRSMDDRTPHNGADLAAVHDAELIPQRTDGSLDGDVARGLAYQAQEHWQSMTGERYAWDGEDLARRAADPNGFTKP